MVSEEVGLTDEQISAIEDKPDEGLTDEQISSLEKHTEPESPSKVRSFFEGLGDTATLGFGDELAGVAGSAMEGFKPGSYTEARDFARRSKAESSAANPKTAFGGQLLGAIASAVATGKIIPIPTTRLGRIALAMGLGGTQGLGYSNAENYTDAAKDVGTGALIGGVTAGALEAVPVIGGKIGQIAKRTAGKWGGAKDPVTAERTGKFLLDEGVATPFRGIEKAQEMVGDIKSDVWKTGMKPAYAAADDLGASVNPRMIAKKFESSYMTPARIESGARVEPAAMEFMNRPNINARDLSLPLSGKNISTTAAANLKTDLGNELANFESTSTFNKAARDQAEQMYGQLNESINKAVEGKLGGSSLKDFIQAKEKYGAASKLVNQRGTGIMDKAVNRSFNRPAMSGLDIGAGAVGGHAGGIIKQSLGALKPGPTIAWSGDKISKILTASPQLFGKYAVPLQNASARGMPALTATNFILSLTQPEYRELQRQLNGQESPEGR